MWFATPALSLLSCGYTMALVPLQPDRCRCTEHGDVCTRFKYQNHCLSQDATLYSFRGEIMFMSKGTVTDWHGEFLEQRPEIIKLSFNCKGGVHLHAATVFRTSPGVYQGVDYLMRRITMRYECSYTWCETCRLWRVPP